MKKPEYLIASAVILGALLFTAILAFSIGKFRYAGGQKHLYVWVESAAGIIPNTQVKFAGAPIGRVDSITVLARDKQEKTRTGLYCVQLGISVDPAVEIGDDSVVSIKQDGMLGSNYISILPMSNTSPVVADGAIFKARHSADFNDLTGSGHELITAMLPVAENLNGITKVLDDSLPTLTENMNELMVEANGLLRIADTPENKERINRLIANLGVITDNLKVVTTNAKALTSTLAQKPWRLIWGGATNPIPPESEVLKSNKPVPIKNVIEVKPAAN